MTPAELTWVDGERAHSLPLPDRGLAFGDGLFETLLLVDGRPVLLEYHRQRLARGLKVLAFPDVGRALDHTLQNVSAAAPSGAAALRVTLTRGGGPRGYLPPSGARPRVIAQLAPQTRPLDAWHDPAKLGVAAIRWPTQPQLAGIKHLNRLEQVLAAKEYRRGGWDEALMLDQRGRAVSVVAGNLFAVIGDRLRTPALDSCGIAGTRRRAVMERWAPALGLAVDEAALSPADLQAARELFYCNSLVGIRAVAALGDARWRDFPVTRALHERYLATLEARA
ncbi:aminodeoxychorismate lyase [Parahaliea mediterranea]|uniref:Aminodeoxychorismate lyase n=1 Tax=Parahaliea mediterranea TaxID=651086 RepID=A0A939DG98_9GAMM|nr:aminodeoxychorismate lyase [Parahaliea mediterranea]